MNQDRPPHRDRGGQHRPEGPECPRLTDLRRWIQIRRSRAASPSPDEAASLQSPAEPGVRDARGQEADRETDGAEALRRHVARCPICRRWVAEHGEGLVAETARLPRERTPRRDLWPDILDRLEERVGPEPAWATGSLRRRRAYLVLAATALLAIGVAVGYGLRPSAGPRDAALGANEASGQEETSIAAASSDAGSTIATYRAATLDLRRAVEARTANLEPAAQAILAEQLAIIESAIAELESALATAGSDPRLEGFLLARYRQQVEMLSRLSAVAG